MIDFKELIKPELLVLVPIMYLIGNFFKQASFVKSYLIPFYIGIISIVLCSIRIFADLTSFSPQLLLMGLFSSITQGIMIAASSVYFYELYHQNQKRIEDLKCTKPKD